MTAAAAILLTAAAAVAAAAAAYALAWLGILAGLLIITAAAALGWAWNSPQDDGGLEALIDATREEIPDYVPDEWVNTL